MAIFIIPPQFVLFRLKSKGSHSDVSSNIKNPLNIRNIGAVKVRDANNAETFGQNCACNTQLNWPQGFLTKFVFLKTLGRGIFN